MSRGIEAGCGVAVLRNKISLTCRICHHNLNCKVRFMAAMKRVENAVKPSATIYS